MGWHLLVTFIGRKINFTLAHEHRDVQSSYVEAAALFDFVHPLPYRSVVKLQQKYRLPSRRFL